jgi:hypothetical protein
MVAHHKEEHEDVGSRKKLRLDFTPYYFMNVFLPIFWFTYLGIAATYVVATLLLPSSLDDSIWIPIIFYSLSTAFVALTIACTSMSMTLQKYDLTKAEMVIKVPMVVAACVLLLRFLVPIVQLFLGTSA